MRRDPVPAVDNRRSGGDQLDRRDLEGLAEGNGRQLHQSDIFLFVHDRGRLARKIDPGLFQEPKLFKIVVKRLRSQPLSHVDKHRVAGIHRSLEEGLGTVAARFYGSGSAGPPQSGNPDKKNDP